MFKPKITKAVFDRYLGHEISEEHFLALLAAYDLDEDQIKSLRTRVRRDDEVRAHSGENAARAKGLRIYDDKGNVVYKDEYVSASLSSHERFLNGAGAVAAVILCTISAIVAATIASAAFAFCGVPVGLTVSWFIGGTYGLLRLRKALVLLPGLVKDVIAKKTAS